MNTDHDLPRHPDAMLNTDEAASALRLQKQTLHDYRCRMVGPPFYRIGGRAIRYRYGDLMAWLESQRVEPVTA